MGNIEVVRETRRCGQSGIAFKFKTPSNPLQYWMWPVRPMTRKKGISLEEHILKHFEARSCMGCSDGYILETEMRDVYPS